MRARDGATTGLPYSLSKTAPPPSENRERDIRTAKHQPHKQLKFGPPTKILHERRESLEITAFTCILCAPGAWPREREGMHGNTHENTDFQLASAVWARPPCRNFTLNSFRFIPVIKRSGDYD